MTQEPEQTDKKLRALILQRFYDDRRLGWSSPSASWIDGINDDSEIYRICDQLHEHGLIKWRPRINGPKGSITASGIDAIEGTPSDSSSLSDGITDKQLRMHLLKRFYQQRANGDFLNPSTAWIGNIAPIEEVRRICRQLSERGWIEWIDNHEYGAGRITSNGTDTIESEESSDDVVRDGSGLNHELEIFLSHGSIDAPVAKLLIALYEKAFKISARKIRCTSVDGHRLPGGAETNDTLRAEVSGAKIFIALLTPDSIKLPYVIMELGARWNTKKHLVPLLAKGFSASDLPAPVNGLNALSVSVPDQVRQHIAETAEALDKQLEPPHSFSAEVDALVACSLGEN